MKQINSDRIKQLDAYKTRFWESYKAGRISEAFEVLRTLPHLYKQPEGFGDLIDNPDNDIRFAFRVEHDVCEVLRTFVNMIGAESDQPGQAETARIDFLRKLAQEFPDWRFALNLLALMLFENGSLEDALTYARASYNLKSNCPFGEHILEKIVKLSKTRGLPRNIILNDFERSLLLELKDFICLKPFTNFEVWRTGEVFVCCGAWVPASIGNVFEQSAEEIWNSPVAKELRRSVLDGDYKYCSRSCMLIGNRLLMKKSDILNDDLEKYRDLWGLMVYKRAPHALKDIVKYIENNETKMLEGPRFVNLAHDFTCNLSCPSCRLEKRIADSEHEKKLDMVRDRVMLSLLPHIHELLIAGDGEPFASKHYRSILTDLNKKKFPNLYLSVLTNGVLFTEHEWKRFENIHDLLYSVSVSVDAATLETYNVLRRGGDWKKLIQNLEFLAGLHQEGKLPYFDLNFVVQEKNFREMKEFVELGRRLCVDKVRFVMLRNDSLTFSPEEFMNANVFAPGNPHYHELLEILEDPIFKDLMVLYPKIEMTNSK